MRLNPGISVLAVIAVLASVGAGIYANMSRNGSAMASNQKTAKGRSESGDTANMEQSQETAPPVPPGFESADEPSKDTQNHGRNFLGGEYTDTVPMRYEENPAGLGCNRRRKLGGKHNISSSNLKLRYYLVSPQQFPDIVDCLPRNTPLKVEFPYHAIEEHLTVLLYHPYLLMNASDAHAKRCSPFDCPSNANDCLQYKCRCSITRKGPWN